MYLSIYSEEKGVQNIGSTSISTPYIIRALKFTAKYKVDQILDTHIAQRYESLKERERVEVTVKNNDIVLMVAYREISGLLKLENGQGERKGDC